MLKERLHPGKMLLVDTVKGKIYPGRRAEGNVYNKAATLTENGWTWQSGGTQDLKIPNMRVESTSR